MNTQEKGAANAGTPRTQCTPTVSPSPVPCEKKDKLDDPTKTLFSLVVWCPTLAKQFGVKVSPDGNKIHFADVPRPWLRRDGAGQLCFDPDRYASNLDSLSSGERSLALFVLNLWNRHYADSKGWNFDVFRAAKVLDSENLWGLAEILKSPVWP